MTHIITPDSPFTHEQHMKKTLLRLGDFFSLIDGGLVGDAEDENDSFDMITESTEAPLAETTSSLSTAVSAPILEALIPGIPGVDYFPESHKPSKEQRQKINEGL